MNMGMCEVGFHSFLVWNKHTCLIISQSSCMATVICPCLSLLLYCSFDGSLISTHFSLSGVLSQYATSSSMMTRKFVVCCEKRNSFYNVTKLCNSSYYSASSGMHALFHSCFDVDRE